MLAARIEGDTLPRSALYVQAVLQGDRAVSWRDSLQIGLPYVD
jgi:hypothetical protein